MSSQSRLVAGILLILLPTVEFGGASILSLLIGGLRHAALDVDLFELMQTPEGKATVAGKSLLGTIRKLMPTLR